MLLKMCQNVGKQEVLQRQPSSTVASLSEAFILGRQHQSRGTQVLGAVRRKEGLTARMISNPHVCTTHHTKSHWGPAVNSSLLSSAQHGNGLVCLQLKAYVAGYFAWPRNRANANELQRLCMLTQKVSSMNVTTEQCEAAIKSLDSMPWLVRLPAIHSLVRTVTQPCQH